MSIKYFVKKCILSFGIILFTPLLLPGGEFPAHDSFSAQTINNAGNDTHTIHACSGEKESLLAAPELAKFQESMAKIQEVMQKLRHDDLSTFSSIDLIISGDADTTRKGYKKAIETIKMRIDLGDALLQEIQCASNLYAGFSSLYTVEWNQKIQKLADEFDLELSKAIDKLDKETDAFSKTLDVERLDIFDYMANDKVELIKAVRGQYLNAGQLKTPVFAMLEAAVKLSKNVDQTQLLFLEYVVCCMDMHHERKDIEKTMTDLNMVNYLDVLEGQSIDAGNISSALNFTFAHYMKNALPPAPSKKKPQEGEFAVKVWADRGNGGIYHAGTHDKINFTIVSSHDCWFILRHRNSMGEERQLCPNECYPKENFLKANVPLVIPGNLSYDFVAQPPYGIDVLEVVASPRKIEYLADEDKLALGKYRGPKRLYTQMKKRGVNIQGRQNLERLFQGNAYYEVSYDPDSGGNAVVASTFVRVLP